MYAIIDCDNCFVSCERVFRPDLNGRPVVVLSNNDGCVVARSNEAKRLGIKEGMPYFKMRQQFGEEQVVAFSSNYELYGELTGRVVSIVKQEAPQYFRYSIDECFAYLHGMDHLDLKRWGEELHVRIRRSVGMPVSIGIANTKTLAKVAARFAKRYPGYRHCCLIDDEEKRHKALELTSIEDVWGIGRRYAKRLDGLGVKTALAFAEKPATWVNATFNNISIYRTWAELCGDDCVPNEKMAPKQSIVTSRSFSGMISEYDELKVHVSNFAARCAEKLRRQHSVATVVGVFLGTNRFREDLSQYWNFKEQRILTPTSSTITLVQLASSLLAEVYRVGYQYKKAGVVVMGVEPDDAVQTDLFDIPAERISKLRQLDAVVDRLNRVNGTETVVLGAQQYWQKAAGGKADKFANVIRHDFRSPNPTTRWSDIIRLK